MHRPMLIAATVLGLAACASGGGSGQPRGARPNPDVITAEELGAAHVQTAYDAVSQLRPGFLATQGATTRSHTVQVVVDNMPRGGVSVLRNIPASEVVDIRRMSASEATMHWGTGFTGGAIVVRTVAGGERK